jgi:hypothetical protein
VPSTQDIFSHTPEWVQLVLPILGVLCDTAYGHDVNDTDAEWSRNYSQNKSKVFFSQTPPQSYRW